jgi:Family of unknown function (DUF5335)
MNTNIIGISKSIPRERWVEFFDQFSDGNYGRHISIEVIDSELGNEELIRDVPLMAMIYDPPNKGDFLTIEMGLNEVIYAHTVDEPLEVLTGQDENGKMMVMSIKDAAGIQTLIKLQAE